MRIKGWFQAPGKDCDGIFVNGGGFWEHICAQASYKIWMRAKGGLDEHYSYMGTSADNASLAAYRRNEKTSLLSAESLPENSSLIDFKTFAKEHPDRLFPLLYNLRPEFQELFTEYYVLGKSQSFLAKVHGQIQTRIWQNLRIIEDAIGALIVLGPTPSRAKMFTILGKVGMDYTEYGSLANLISLYAKGQNYAAVAKAVDAPVPAIRKIFRPAIEQLLRCRDLEAVTIGCYLRSLTHQASLTGKGLSKRCIARNARVKCLRYTAPATDVSALLEFGLVNSLKDAPWNMFEISSDRRMAVIFPALRKQGKEIFGKRGGQIFAPLDANGELEFGYILARSLYPKVTRRLTHINGISEMSGSYNSEDVLVKAVTVPNEDVQKLIADHCDPKVQRVKVGDFVEITTGDAKAYCGTIVGRKGENFVVEVDFPSKRQFVVTADPSALRLITHVNESHRAFWGIKI